MRKLILSSALASTALALSACQDVDVADDISDEIEENRIDVEEMAEPAGVMDASTATADDLAGIAQIDEDLAAAIVEGQPYASITDLNAVLTSTLSEEDAAAVREVLFVPVNLNSATREELALIPGIDDRMIHEFEEYVPYDDMDEFDREIGKYVDADEVARYRQYVTL